MLHYSSLPRPLQSLSRKSRILPTLRRNIQHTHLQIPRRRRTMHTPTPPKRHHRLGRIPRSRARISGIMRHMMMRICIRRNIRLGGFEVQVPAEVERDAAHHCYLDPPPAPWIWIWCAMIWWVCGRTVMLCAGKPSRGILNRIIPTE